MLNDDEKTRIQLEEQYRHEVRQTLGGAGEKPKRKGLLWEFFNSSLGIWFLSTCVVGAISFFYNVHQNNEKLAREQQAATERREIEEKQVKAQIINRNANLVITLLPYLASADDKQRNLALAVSGYLRQKGELPGELEAALVAVAAGDSSRTTPEKLKQMEAAAAIIDQGQGTKLPDSLLTGIPARVYLQISRESDRPLAQKIQSRLRESFFLVPGIAVVQGKATQPNQTEVRYHQDEELPEARRILDVVKQLDPSANPEPQKISREGGRPRQYEIQLVSN
ncbi:MAG: hypothetical protein K1Y36_16735 [Blastocatellia bacterium]|nr:hypothetical protein [Blastocatellia bacterium]